MHHCAHRSVIDEERKALAFCGFLFLFMCVALLGIVSYSGPIVLGTELNANGTVEYLCVGSACENFTDFHWNDK